MDQGRGGEASRRPIEKFLPAPVQQELRERMRAEAGRFAPFRRRCGGHRLLGARHPAHAPGHRSEAFDPAKPEFKIAWVVDFPLVRLGRGGEAVGGQPSSVHGSDGRGSRKAGQRPRHGAGARRTTWSSTATSAAAAASVSTILRCRQHVFAVLGMTPEQARQRFGFLLDALKYGAPRTAASPWASTASP